VVFHSNIHLPCCAHVDSDIWTGKCANLSLSGVRQLMSDASFLGRNPTSSSLVSDLDLPWTCRRSSRFFVAVISGMPRESEFSSLPYPNLQRPISVSFL